MTIAEIDKKIKDYEWRISEICFSAEFLTDDNKKSIKNLTDSIEELKKERKRLENN